MTTQEKVGLVLAVIAIVAPKPGAAAGAAVADGGISQGPASAYRATSAGTIRKSGVAGGSMRSSVQAATNGQAFTAGASNAPGVVKRHDGGGSMADSAPSADAARAFRMGAGERGPKSRVAGGAIASEVTSGHAQTLRLDAQGRAKSGVPGGTLPASPPSTAGAAPALRSPIEDFPSAAR